MNQEKPITVFNGWLMVVVNSQLHLNHVVNTGLMY